jgi:glycosyltransferase involved in cell wall biosynthesis
MKIHPTISVVMSVYNGEKYVDQSVKSILNQTFKDFEFIIIDDGSTDNTLTILLSYKDERIRLIKNEANIGLTKSLNKGIGLASGEYIARQDADDISLPQRFEKQVTFFNENPEYGLVGCRCYRVDLNNKTIGKELFFTEHNDIVSMLLNDNHFVHSSVMLRKDCIDKVGSYNEYLKYAQDYDLWLRISEYYKVANLGEFLHLWRYSKHGISVNQRKEQKKYALLVKDEFIKRVIKKSEWQAIIENTYEKNKDNLMKKCVKEIMYHRLIQGKSEKSKRKIKVTAIISAFNEEDIIAHVLSDLIGQGIQVYFIDHHSTDKTMEIVNSFLGKGVNKVEIFPEDSGYSPDVKDVFAWRCILKRKEELHSLLGADWYIHMDADAIIESPWKNITFLEAIQLADTLGYNCINFELFNFRPVKDRYENNIRPQEFFEYWEPVDFFDELQIKCWKNIGQQIDLVSSGGHDVKFEGKKIFPLKFVMKHYPIRSKEHGIKKIFYERLPRFDTMEKSDGMHVQYEGYISEKDIKFDKTHLLKYDDDIIKQIYLPFISCWDINMINYEKEQQIQEMSSKIKSIYASRSWKAGRILAEAWGWMKTIALLKKPS